jgi:hypothetical protein
MPRILINNSTHVQTAKQKFLGQKHNEGNAPKGLNKERIIS